MVTALLLVPLVVVAALWLPTPAFALFLGTVVLVAAWEWCNLAGASSPVQRAGFVAATGLAMLLAWLFPQWQIWLLAGSVLWWVVQGARIAALDRIRPASGFDFPLLAVGLLVLIPSWVALVRLDSIPNVGPGLVLFLFLLVWTADTAAYFAGRRWGRAKLAPVVSPGKTRAGVYGALVGAGACGLLLGWIGSFGFARTLAAALVCALVAAVSVIGDLYESWLKRRRGVKDSGRLLPGHGGLLDRIDSMTAAAPAFALGLVALGVGS